MDMPTQVKDHEKRLRVVEAFMYSDGEKTRMWKRLLKEWSVSLRLPSRLSA